MTLLKFLIRLDNLGVTEMFKDGTVIVFGIDYRRHDARRFRRLLRQGRREGLQRKLLTFLLPLPLDCRNVLREGWCCHAGQS